MTRLAELPARGWEWFRARAHGRHAAFWLGALAFAESSFFLVPPDVLLVAILLAGADRWARYAALTTAASVAGGLFGYALGALFFDTAGAGIISFYGLGEEFAAVRELFRENAFAAIFAAAFTPIPYKVFVLAAGFFGVGLAPFLLASVAGRGLRFFLVAWIVRQFGEEMLRLFLRLLNVATILLLLALALAAFFSFR